MSDNVIPFKTRTTGLPLTATSLSNVELEDDVLADRQIHLMMQAYHSSGVYRSFISHTTVEPRGHLQHTYAEQLFTEQQLLPFAIRTPARTICAPVKNELVNRALFEYLDNYRNAHRVYIISSCAWFFGKDISKGLLSMLLGNQSDRMVNEIDDIFNTLREHGALILTTETMKQQVQPSGVVFSKDENRVYRASRKTLYRDVEKVMFILNALAHMDTMYHYTIQKWASKPWPGIASVLPHQPHKKEGQNL